MSISAKNISDVLGDAKGLGKRILTMRDLESIVADGLSKSALDTLSNPAAATRLYDAFTSRARESFTIRNRTH